VALLDRPLLVISDTHLGAGAPARICADLARLIEAHPGAEIILGGDAFDLSYAKRYDEQPGFLSAALERSPELVAVLHKRLVAGAPVTLLPGNHDATLCDANLAGLLRARLGVADDAPINVNPWFLRRGDIHVEHGHLYDPDNAPIHPLAEWSEKSEPLGIALTRRFVAVTGASDFSHAQDATPVRALARAFRLYGRRAPGMIANYFKTAIELCLESGPALAPRAELERALGSARLDEFSSGIGLPPSALAQIVEEAPSPTHLRRSDVFLRLYFDRIFATLLFGVSVAGVPRRPLASVLALASFAYLAASTLRGHDRYGALPAQRLQEGASRIRELTGARLVVFGHTHRAVVDAGYFNTGSFAFPYGQGHPYVFISESGEAELRRQSTA
jgi:UDP-2,3-diacylglucosamine pyrophosphatase LpxH